MLDFNGDDRQDLIVGRHYRGFFHLYRNDGGGNFTDVHETAFPVRKENRDRHGCAAADVDRNGLQDIYCTTGGKKGGTGPNSNELWMQTVPGAFVEQAEERKVTDAYGRGRKTVFLKANGDRFPDLLVGNTFPRKDGRSGANHLYINQDGEFRRAKSFGLDRTVGSNSLQVTDLGGAGRNDVMLCGPRGIKLYKNVANRRYRDVTRRKEADLECRAAALGRINGGERLDLVRITGGALSVHPQRGSGFGRKSYRLPVEGGYELALGDVNRDRRADIYLLRRGRFNRDLRDIMLINRRGGPGFRRVAIPQTRRGVGEAVTSLDYNADGRADFLVQNGHRKAKGPTRMISFR